MPKALLYGLIQIAAGIVTVRWLAARAWGESSTQVAALDPRLSQGAVLVSWLILLALLMRAWAHTASAFGPLDALVWDNFRLVTLDSQWGASWRIQCYAALALMGTAGVAGRARGGWIAYVGTVLVFCASLPLLGHASGSWFRHGVHAMHIIAGAVWLGSLVVLVWLRLSNLSRPPATAPSLETPFSPIALRAAAAVVATGVVAAWIYVGALDLLFSTAYGRLLLAKIVGVGAVVACGWLNWQRVRAGVAPSVGIMSSEAVFALVVVSVTSVLTETEQP